MWEVTRKGLLAHKFRLLLTSISIILGVGFVADAAVHPVRTRTIALAAPSQAMRCPIDLQRAEAPRRAPRKAASGVEKAA